MDISTFYAVTAATATCFTSVGRWWARVRDKRERFMDEATRCPSGGAYASFLIPALSGMGTQKGGVAQPMIRKVIFITTSLLGIHYSFYLFPGLACWPGLHSLQVEGVLFTC